MQKTAYELRISDCSSDVCSSDLVLDQPRQALRTLAEDTFGGTDQIVLLVGRAIVGGNVGGGHVGGGVGGRRAAIDRDFARLLIAGRKVAVVRRSEEHTSELPSLMRISYAVFCLKKKNYNDTQQSHR